MWSDQLNLISAIIASYLIIGTFILLMHAQRQLSFSEQLKIWITIYDELRPIIIVDFDIIL